MVRLASSLKKDDCDDILENGTRGRECCTDGRCSSAKAAAVVFVVVIAGKPPFRRKLTVSTSNVAVVVVAPLPLLGAAKNMPLEMLLWLVVCRRWETMIACIVLVACKLGRWCCWWIDWMFSRL